MIRTYPKYNSEQRVILIFSLFYFLPSGKVERVLNLVPILIRIFMGHRLTNRESYF